MSSSKKQTHAEEDCAGFGTPFPPLHHLHSLLKKRCWAPACGPAGTPPLPGAPPTGATGPPCQLPPGVPPGTFLLRCVLTWSVWALFLLLSGGLRDSPLLPRGSADPAFTTDFTEQLRLLCCHTKVTARSPLPPLPPRPGRHDCAVQLPTLWGVYSVSCQEFWPALWTMLRNLWLKPVSYQLSWN